MVRKLVLASGLLALVTACSADTTGSPASTPAGPTTTTSSADAPGPAAGTCPVGQYDIATISGKAGTEVNGVPIVAKSGGGLKLALTQEGKWTLTGAGATVTLEAAGVSAAATVDGTAEGSYAKSGSDYLFRQEKATGKVTLKQAVAGISSFSMDEVGPALAPDGKATLTCGPDSLKITSESVVLDLKAANPSPAPTSSTGGTSGGGGGSLTINDSAQTKTIDCAGRDVAMNGSSSKLTFTGTCGSVSVNGSSNELTLAKVSQLTVNGANNKITYGGDPKISNNGTGNTLTRR